ncbi:MAG: 2-octaprenyl-6-methoxyphenyl hydroxylase [Halieaceae bacterium]
MNGPAHQDVVIAGGGMVGISLALSLRQRLPVGTRILLVESFPLPAADDSTAAFSPSFDSRSTALSYASCLIYQQLGIWPDLEPGACPISSIHVSEQGRFGSTLMQASDYSWPALGYVVENAWLGQILVQALHRSDIETLSPARVSDALAIDSGMLLTLDDGDQLQASLLVVADGADSALRQALGIEAREQHYEQHALIANIGHASAHQGCAYERFTEQGPLAMLPLLPTADSAGRSALVWSLAPALAAELQECPEREFLQRLQQEFGYRLGRLQRLGQRHSYPLSLVQAEEQARSGVVVMGNAAHSLHPVAGQGFNLALRDVARLAELLAQAVAAGRAPGELSVLQAYCEQQAQDQERTTVFSDRLPGLFMQRDPALALLRDIGLFALDLSPALKRQFVRHTAGVAASSEYRDVQP